MKILLVESKPSDVRLALRAIRQTCPWAEVEILSDGQSALERIEVGGQEDAPDLVLLSWYLPRVDGSEVYARLRGGKQAWMRSLRVVVMSAMVPIPGAPAGLRVARKPLSQEALAASPLSGQTGP